jgi:hypothetical protein
VLNKLVSVAGNVLIAYNSDLTSLAGWSLTSLYQLSINNNIALSDISSLSLVASTGPIVSIEANNLIASFIITLPSYTCAIYLAGASMSSVTLNGVTEVQVLILSGHGNNLKYCYHFCSILSCVPARE